MLNGLNMAMSQIRTMTGTYSMCALSGVMAAGLAGAAEIFQFRWTSTTKAAILRHLHLHAAVNTTGFTAGNATFNSILARAFTAAGGGGGVLTITGNNGKLMTAMATTAVGEIRVSDTAALTAGTKTLDANPFGTIVTGVGTAAGQDIIQLHDLAPAEHPDGHPIVLMANEGMVITATVPATGTWKFGIEMCWEEGELR